jgi:hypothetical protein
LFKKQREKYGHVPPKEAEELLWSRVNGGDLIGPYLVRTPKSKHTLHALTMIDPVTGWFEVIAIPEKNAHTVMEAFNNTWLACRSGFQFLHSGRLPSRNLQSGDWLS